MVEAAAVHVDGEALVAVVIGVFELGRVVPDEGEQAAPVRHVVQAEVGPAAVRGRR